MWIDVLYTALINVTSCHLFWHCSIYQCDCWQNSESYSLTRYRSTCTCTCTCTCMCVCVYVCLPAIMSHTLHVATCLHTNYISAIIVGNTNIWSMPIRATVSVNWKDIIVLVSLITFSSWIWVSRGRSIPTCTDIVARITDLCRHGTWYVLNLIIYALGYRFRKRCIELSLWSNMPLYWCKSEICLEHFILQYVSLNDQTFKYVVWLLEIWWI